MNKLSRHISAGAILLLFLFYSTPLSFLHHCRNFNQHEHHDGFHQAHEDCKICEIQLLPFDENVRLKSSAAHTYDIQLACFQAPSPLLSFIQSLKNKGPPVAFHG